MICDLAETYHLFFYRECKPSLIAVLVSGLREDSRLYHAISGGISISDNTLLAVIADRLGEVLWAGFSKKGAPQPKQLVNIILGEQKKKPAKNNYRVSKNIDEFMKLRYGKEVKNG